MNIQKSSRKNRLFLTLLIGFFTVGASLYATNPPDPEGGKEPLSGGCDGKGGSLVPDPDDSCKEICKEATCIMLNILMDAMPNEPNFDPVVMKYYTLGANSNLGSTRFIKLNGNPWMRITEVVKQAEDRVYTIVQASGNTIKFRIAPDRAATGEYIIGRPIGGEAYSEAYVTYVTADGEPADYADAAYLRQYRTDGGYVEYPTTLGYAQRMVSDQGRTWEFDELPVTVIAKKSNGTLYERLQPDFIKDTIRQVRTPAGLLDVVELTSRHFEVRKYASEQITGQEGLLYTVEGDPVEIFAMEAPAGTKNQANFSRTRGSFVADATYVVDVNEAGEEEWVQEVKRGEFTYTRTLSRKTRAGQNGYRDDVLYWFSVNRPKLKISY